MINARAPYGKFVQQNYENICAYKQENDYQELKSFHNKLMIYKEKIEYYDSIIIRLLTGDEEKESEGFEAFEYVDKLFDIIYEVK